MSNFLEKFEKGNYQKTKKNINKPVARKEEDKEIAIEKISAVSKEIKAKTIQKSKHRHYEEEIIEIDKSFDIKQKRKKVMIILSALLAVILCTGTFLFFNMTVVPYFVEKKQSTAEAWAKENNVTIQLNKIYSKEKELDIIIKQDKTEGTYIFKGSTVTLTISKGADPNEYVAIPDFTIMNQRELEEWIGREKLTNTKIDLVYNPNIPANTFVEAKFEDSSVTNGTFKRRDTLILTVSKGAKPIEKNINVPDFTNKPKEEVITWSKANQVEIQFKESADDKVMEGSVISQNVPAGQKVSTVDVIEVILSLGKGVKVPNFSNVTKTSAITIVPELHVTVKEVYANVGYGKFISQSVQAGTILTGENKKIEVTYSIGKPFIDNLVGKNLKELEQYFAEMNEKGANVSYKIAYEAAPDSTIVKGTVIKSSVSNNYIGFGSTVMIYIAQ